MFKWTEFVFFVNVHIFSFQFFCSATDRHEKRERKLYARWLPFAPSLIGDFGHNTDNPRFQLIHTRLLLFTEVFSAGSFPRKNFLHCPKNSHNGGHRHCHSHGKIKNRVIDHCHQKNPRRGMSNQMFDNVLINGARLCSLVYSLRFSTVLTNTQYSR